MIVRSLERVAYLLRRLALALATLERRDARVAFGELSRRSRRYDVRWRGHVVTVRVGLHESDVRTMSEVLVRDVYDFPITAHPRWIIDAGANNGMSTLWFATRYPTATVVALEPGAENLELLRHNVRELDNVVVVEGALGGTSGTRTLVDVGYGPWALQLRDHADLDGVTPVGRVSVMTVADLLDSLGIDRVDLLKLDIEGSEAEVMADASGWIHRVDAIAAELHDRNRPGCSRAFVEATRDFPVERHRGENFFVARCS